eukprot:3692019-Pyramimonas_sp.AAC.1
MWARNSLAHQRHVGRVAEVDVQVPDVAPDRGVVGEPSRPTVSLISRKLGFKAGALLCSNSVRILRRPVP